MTRRHYLLGLVLIITIVAAIYPNQNKPAQIVETTATRTAEPAHALRVVSATQGITFSPRKWEWDKDTHDLFSVKPIEVETSPPPKKAPQPVVVTPTQPLAPPLPFTYLGKLIEEDRITVFVANAGRNYALKGGEVIDGMYAVQSIDGQKIVFNYVPLKIEQILVTRSAN